MSYGFDTNGDRLDGTFARTYAVDNNNSLTMMCWLKRTAAQWDAGNGTAMHISTIPFDREPGAIIQIGRTQIDQMSSGRYDAADDQSFANLNFTANLYDDTWVPVIVVLTNDSLADIYIQDSTLTGQSTSTRVIGMLLDQIMIGNGPPGAGGFLDGLVAEVCFWDRALIPAEIDQFWTSANSGPAPNTVAPENVIGYYPLDEDGVLLNFGSDTGGDLTANNAQFDSDHPTITAGPTQVITRGETVSTFTSTDPGGITEPDIAHTVDPDTTLLLVYIGIEGNELVSGVPTW
ncbi:MAG: LamG-like jellyroll fold domain-containing protein, partial [Dehalococcoidales bacterium]